MFKSLKALFVVLLPVTSVAATKPIGFRLGEGCFGDTSRVFSARPATPRNTLAVADLETVVAWLTREYAANVQVHLDYEALTFNAAAGIDKGVRRVKLNLGLILHPLITKDVLALIGCHEIGHHMGGPPQASSQPLSYEGQADFFAPQACFHRWMYTRETVDSPVRPEVAHYCLRFSDKAASKEYCLRTLEASVRLAEIFAGVKKTQNPLLDNSDPTEVAQSIIFHGSPQCRLDTFRAGYASFTSTPTQRPTCWFKE